MTFRAFTLLFLTLLLVGCAQSPTDNAATASQPVADITQATASATAAPTATATASATPSPTPTTTPTPSPTPTPTPTAVPLIASGSPRTSLLSDPIPHNRNLCGLVDVFDFPIDPPDAANVSRGGSDFGIFRQRFDKYHAGEDWGGPDGRSNLGAPVYSIGHGVVTFAQPLGWGRDQGVVIVQHSFPDGYTVAGQRSLLSFYGHLAPESITLRPGDCVARGQRVGVIGDPRSSPHLHFEIRTQAPYATLTGYWPDDPTTQGWLPPSQIIWEQRLAVSPGVVWTRPFTSHNPTPLGVLADGRFLLLEDGNLRLLDPVNGREQPLPLPADLELTPTSALSHGDNLIIGGRGGALAALSLPDLALRWTATLPSNGSPELFAVPDGGVLAAIRDDYFALDKDGALLWQQELGARPFHTTVTGDSLLLTTGGSDPALWQISGAEPPRQLADIGGKVAVSDGQLWLYGGNGLYRLALNSADAAPELVLPLPTALLTQSDLRPLPGGGVLLAHQDIFASRLIALDADGHLLWDRAISQLARGADLRLQALDEQHYLATYGRSGGSGSLNLYRLQLAPPTLDHIFSGGTRTARPGSSWTAVANPDTLLLNIGGGHLVGFAPDTAISLITQNP